LEIRSPRRAGQAHCKSLKTGNFQSRRNRGLGRNGTGETVGKQKRRLPTRLKDIGGHVYKTRGEWEKGKQARWAKDMKRQVDRGERDLIDIGRDPDRLEQLVPPSEAYSIEQRIFYGE
jgi:hypothetical protein